MDIPKLKISENINYQSHLSREYHNDNHVDACFDIFKTLDASIGWHFHFFPTLVALLELFDHPLGSKSILRGV